MFPAKRCGLALLSCAFLFGLTPGGPALARQAPAAAAMNRMPGEFNLKAASAPLATAPESRQDVAGASIAFNISQPTLTPFLPPAGRGNGTAVVIAPGGGFMMLSISSEGYDVARWLADNGVAAFVLKYRLSPSGGDVASVSRALLPRLDSPDKFQRTQWWADGLRVATEDAQEAMRVVRGNAAKWKIDPKKVGFMGFSAGGFTTLSLVSRNDPATMPDFVAPIYSSVDTPVLPLPAKLPPMWNALAGDDPIFHKTDFGLLRDWREKGGAFEFHMYEKGGHGYGFKGTAGTTTQHWTGDFLAWLRSHGL